MSEESKSWYRMTRPLFNSGYEDDEFWAYGRDGFQEVLDSFIGSDVEVYDKTLSVEPKIIRAIVQQTTSDVYNSTVVRQILCNIGTLKCGQYIKCEDAYWLVSSLPDNNRIYEKAVLWKCKHSIRFMSPLTGEIVEYPVYSKNSTQYGTGIAEKTQMDVGEDQHLIYIPYNEETIMIENDFRFLMDKNRVSPSAYRITRVDPVSYAVGDEKLNDGLIEWAALQTQFNEATDNKDLMIADYYGKNVDDNSKIPGDGGTLLLTDEDGDNMLALGETKQITISCLSQNGEEIKNFSYQLEYDLADGAATVLSESENAVALQASNDRRFVGANILIRATSAEIGSEATIRIKIVNW